MRKCPATLETNHLLTVDFTLEYWKEIKRRFLCFHWFLSFCFSLESRLIFQVWALITVGYQFSFVISYPKFMGIAPGADYKSNKTDVHCFVSRQGVSRYYIYSSANNLVYFALVRFNLKDTLPSVSQRYQFVWICCFSPMLMCASIGNNSVKDKLYCIKSHYPALEMITGKGEVIEI